mgnify:FL=1
MNGPVTCHLDLAHEWRGGQRQVYWLAAGLAERGLRTLAITGRDTPLAQRLAGTGVEVHQIGWWGEWDILAARRVAAIAQNAGAQILAAHASHPLTLALLAKKFGAPVKVVGHRRVDVPIKPQRWKYTAPDAMIAISEVIGDLLRTAGVAEEKLHVVSSGVPAHEFDPDAKTRLAAEFSLPVDAPWVGNVADLVEHKGQTHLLAAWPQVVARHPQARLIVIGEGPLRVLLQRQAEASGVADSVRLIGRRDDIAAWFSSFAAFAMTSVSEGLCTSILDAMAARVPVVATAAGGIPELVRDGETGRLALSSDSEAIARHLSAVLDDPSAQRETVERAFAMVRDQRSVTAMIEGTLAVYRDLLR